MKSRKLSYRTLLDAGACIDQRMQFQERFVVDPNEPALETVVEVTVELAVEQADDWAWTWAAEELLSEAGYEEYHKVEQTALTEYRAAMAAFWKATEDSYEAARNAYDAVLNAWGEEHPQEDFPTVVLTAANQAWEEIRSPIIKAEDEAQSFHHHALKVIQARTFAEIYIREGEGNGE